MGRVDPTWEGVGPVEGGVGTMGRVDSTAAGGGGGTMGRVDPTG